MSLIYFQIVLPPHTYPERVRKSKSDKMLKTGTLEGRYMYDPYTSPSVSLKIWIFSEWHIQVLSRVGYVKPGGFNKLSRHNTSILLKMFW